MDINDNIKCQFQIIPTGSNGVPPNQRGVGHIKYWTVSDIANSNTTTYREFPSSSYGNAVGVSLGKIYTTFNIYFENDEIKLGMNNIIGFDPPYTGTISLGNYSYKTNNPLYLKIQTPYDYNNGGAGSLLQNTYRKITLVDSTYIKGYKEQILNNNDTWTGGIIDYNNGL